MLDNQDIYELPPQDRWKLIPYEIKLRLSRNQYSKETADAIIQLGGNRKDQAKETQTKR
jgi:hypothetical protein